MWAIAGGDPLKLDAAFDLEYNTAHVALVRMAMDARYQKRLHNILTESQK